MTLHPKLLWAQARWQALGSRERLGLGLAGVLVLAMLLWQLFIAAALTTLRSADAQMRTLDDQLQHMQVLANQAKTLQSQPALGFDEALRALTLATQQTLGNTANLTVSADQARVTLKDASADNLARWLAQARLNARSLPLEARLSKSAAANATTGAVWSGVLVMALPKR
jgi:general secretion pathway protein M